VAVHPGPIGKHRRLTSSLWAHPCQRRQFRGLGVAGNNPPADLPLMAGEPTACNGGRTDYVHQTVPQAVCSLRCGKLRSQIVRRTWRTVSTSPGPVVGTH
jgi:hypothetical protein